jgi:hypothetical protein
MVSLIPPKKLTILKITEYESIQSRHLPFRNHFDLCSFNSIKKKSDKNERKQSKQVNRMNAKYGLNKRVKVWIEYTNHAMIFLRYSSLAFLTSALVSIFLVAKTLIFSAPLDFLIFLLSYFSDFLFGFLLGRMLNCLSLKFGSYLTKYCWLS